MAARESDIINGPDEWFERDGELELAEEALAELAAEAARLALAKLDVNERIRELESGVKKLRRKRARQKLEAPLEPLRIRLCDFEEAD